MIVFCQQLCGHDHAFKEPFTIAKIRNFYHICNEFGKPAVGWLWGRRCVALLYGWIGYWAIAAVLYYHIFAMAWVSRKSGNGQACTLAKLTVRAKQDIHQDMGLWWANGFSVLLRREKYPCTRL